MPALVLATVSFFVLTLAAAALAQPAAAPAGGALVGSWQAEFPNPGGPPLLGGFTFRPDGSYREELWIQGQLAAFWEGRYTLAPDGTLTQHETHKSPQLCFQGECQPNDGPPTTVSRVAQPAPDTVTLTYLDGPASVQVTLRRAPGAAAQNGGPTPPPASTPGTPPGTPAGSGDASAPARPWTGSWSDGDLTLHLRGPTESYLERGGTRFPLQLTSADGRLEGSFHSDGHTFPVVLEQIDGGIVLLSGELRFTLRPLAPAGPAQPANPLGN